MSRYARQRLEDILAAIDAIRSHLTRGDLSDGLVFDAIRVRLIEIGEAVKAVPADLLAHEPHLPWVQIAGLRDRLAHRYFDTSHAILAATVERDLPELERAVRLLARSHLGGLSRTPSATLARSHRRRLHRVVHNHDSSAAGTPLSRHP